MQWKCPIGHIYKSTPGSRALEGHGCPYCSGHQFLKGFNDLATRHPEIAAEADGWDPSLFGRGSTKKMNWLCLSFGYSVDQKLVGDENLYLDFKASRQFLFSLDVDLTRLPIKNPTLKKVLSHLNMIKIPFPALLFQQGKVYAKPIYF
jgi:hypothetical protein